MTEDKVEKIIHKREQGKRRKKLYICFIGEKPRKSGVCTAIETHDCKTEYSNQILNL